MHQSEMLSKRVKQVIQFLLISLMLFYPWIVYFHLDRPAEWAKPYYGEQVLDYFVYNRELILLGISMVIIILMLLDWAWGIPKPCAKKTKWLLGLLVAYGLLSFLSCFFSEYKSISWLGLYQEREGFYAIICYLILFWAAFKYFDQNDLSRIAIVIVILGLILGLAGTLEHFCGSLLEHVWFVQLLTPTKYAELGGSFMSPFGARPYLGFGNPNILAAMCLILLPPLLACGYYWNGWKKYVSWTSSFLLGFTCYATGSTGAIYILMVILIIMIGFTHYKKKLIGQVGYIGMGFGLLICLSIFLRPNQLYSPLVNSHYTSSQQVVHLDSIQLTSNTLDVKGEGVDMLITWNQEKGFVIENTDLAYTRNGEVYLIPVNKTRSIQLTMGDQQLYLDLGYESPLRFTVQNDKVYYVGLYGYLYENIPQPEVKGMENIYSILTGRGYTWIQSLPRLSKCLLLGQGIGSFPFEFRQNEVVGLLKTHGSANLMVEKAHNWYLQVALNTGIPSLMILFCLFGWPFWQLARHYQQLPVLLIGISLSLLAYAAYGLINDSSVMVSPYFWIWLGLAYKLYVIRSSSV